MTTLVEFVEVSKTFRAKLQRVKAVDNLSFRIDDGESVGFVGQNGAGKSTSLKMLMGMLQPDTGVTYLQGLPAKKEASRCGVGYVPESPYLYDYLTPLEIVSMGLSIHGRAQGSEARTRALQWLERLGIGYAAHKRVRNLSKGMTQRTALAHALALEPRLLILDEPMSGLDPAGRKQVADELLLYRKSGGTVFFSSHILNDVERLASRVILIHRGKLCADQPTSELLLRQDRMLVRYRGASSLPGFEEESAAVWKSEVHNAQLWNTLHAIAEAGGQLLEARPGQTLEQIFVDVIGEKQQ